jgi:nucleoside-diphosphate-sugar epimerase
MPDRDLMNSPHICALTGSTGYVGSVLLSTLGKRMKVLPLTRRPVNGDHVAWNFHSERDISPDLRLHGVDVLIHAAWDMQANSLDELRATVVRGTERLYSAAVRAGVKRIIFISTISAFEGCRSAYGQSKLEVERMTHALGGLVLRLGLVYGPTPGGVFGTLRRQIQSGTIIPLIGTGHAPQYLLHEETLKEVAVRAAIGDLDDTSGDPFTLAHPKPWAFRDLLIALAKNEKRKVILIPLPWRLLYAGLRCSEMLNLKLPVRSDSVISFVYQNPAPDFSKIQQYGISPIPFLQSEV